MIVVERKKNISELTRELYGDSTLYSNILKKYVANILKKYKNKELQRCFDVLPYKFISICPMALCDSLLKDLKIKASESDLAALGFVMFGISMHDDVVDEQISDRQAVADLLFSGNIACNEGINILLKEEKIKELQCLLSVVNENHFYQQYNIYTLWKDKPSNFCEYIDGLQHDIVFMRIGLEYALAIANENCQKELLEEFAKYYGLGIQLLDDLREVEEDRIVGYNSYPTIEGAPFKVTIKKLLEYSQKANESLDENWIHLKKISKSFNEVVNEFVSQYI